MSSLRINGGKSLQPCVAILILLLSACAASAQITIGGITIPKPKRANKPRAEEPATKQAPPQTSEDNSASAATRSASPEAPPAPKPVDVRISLFLDDIKKETHEVETYNPADKLYLASRVQENFLLLAVSQSARKAYLAKWSSAAGVEQLNPALDALAAALTQKLPTYRPNINAFKFHDPAAEKLLMGAVGNPATVKIHRIGVGTAGWLIQKDDYGLPRYRYKDVSAYIRNVGDDHPYCHLISARVKQDYAGGGTYSTELYRSSAEDDLFGCP